MWTTPSSDLDFLDLMPRSNFSQSVPLWVCWKNLVYVTSHGVYFEATTRCRLPQITDATIGKLCSQEVWVEQRWVAVITGTASERPLKMSFSLILLRLHHHSVRTSKWVSFPRDSVEEEGFPAAFQILTSCVHMTSQQRCGKLKIPTMCEWTSSGVGDILYQSVFQYRWMLIIW